MLYSVPRSSSTLVDHFVKQTNSPYRPQIFVKMSNLDPGAPSQPNQQTGLNQAQNPASKTGAEHTSAQASSGSDKIIDHREQHDVPSKHGDAATSTSLGYGDTGPLKEKKIPESDALGYSKDGNLDGEQMRAPGEGEVAEAVRSGGGGGHAEEESLTKNMDDKKQAHEEELHKRGERTAAEIEEENKEDWTDKKANISEALGGRDTKIVLAAEE